MYIPCILDSNISIMFFSYSLMSSYLRHLHRKKNVHQIFFSPTFMTLLRANKWPSFVPLKACQHVAWFNVTRQNSPEITTGFCWSAEQRTSLYTSHKIKKYIWKPINPISTDYSKSYTTLMVFIISIIIINRIPPTLYNWKKFLKPSRSHTGYSSCFTNNKISLTDRLGGLLAMSPTSEYSLSLFPSPGWESLEVFRERHNTE